MQVFDCQLDKSAVPNENLPLIFKSKSGCIRKSTLKSQLEKEMSNIYFKKIPELRRGGYKSAPTRVLMYCVTRSPPLQEGYFLRCGVDTFVRCDLDGHCLDAIGRSFSEAHAIEDVLVLRILWIYHCIVWC